ncbi:RNA-directed DNA polymerase from mobile element jockey [Trichonephila clavata]|uniref:RNA-directed DNA polymerase from mobile element jockey n=1 Tax=Trichonephila clavata TaxID=2740835 RepID=A0A8X6I4Z9_TRICU|nr:RNA-directed DNA polymerase from mobile element jockey [Trichonephila clavata]
MPFSCSPWRERSNTNDLSKGHLHWIRQGDRGNPPQKIRAAQCYRCQGFFHSSKFCTRTPRCVKCAGNHLAKECVKELMKNRNAAFARRAPSQFPRMPKNPKLRIEAEKAKNNFKKRPHRPGTTQDNYWEQRAKNATPRQQPSANIQPGPSTAPPPLNFELTAIQIVRPNSHPITVISAYRSPRKPILIQDLHSLFRNHDYVLVAGDLNAKHHSWSPLTQQNVAGHTIRRFCDSTGFSLNAPLEPTHFHNSLRNTIIDLAICKGMTVTEVTSIPELSSDHNPVLFEYSPRQSQNY